MTQRNIDVMDIIVGKLAEGTKFSKALKLVYSKRNVCIPDRKEMFDVSLMDLGMTSRTTNALLRAKFRTLGEVVEFCKTEKITKITNLGKTSGVELFETILDYCWDHMSNKDREIFLIDAVERNSKYIREEIA